jgi:3-oxoacyl-[acyl-carrier-protein] synthase II
VRQPVSVTGLGIVSPYGTSLAAFRDALLAGRSAIAPIERFDTAGCLSTLGALVAEFEPTQWMAPMKLRRLDPTGVYAVAASRMAIDDARQPLSAEGHDDGGIVLGTWSAGGQAMQEYLTALFRSGPAGVPALIFNTTVGNAAASQVGLEFKLCGPNTTVTHKEASGLAAIVSAVEFLEQGRASWLVAGGVDSVYEMFFKAHDRFAVMSRRPAFGAGMGPFDRDRSGFVMSEGCFVLHVEPADGARARQATTYGDVIGIAAAGAAVPINAWPDRAEPVARTMTMAIADAGLDVEDVDVVYASANGTPQLDAVEGKALSDLFGGRRTVITSVKGALGECGASGVASCVAALLCGRAGRVPPIAGLQSVDPALAALRFATEPAAAAGPIVLVNSFASGGALFSVVFRVAGQPGGPLEVA